MAKKPKAAITVRDFGAEAEAIMQALYSPNPPMPTALTLSQKNHVKKVLSRSSNNLAPSAKATPNEKNVQRGSSIYLTPSAKVIPDGKSARSSSSSLVKPSINTRPVFSDERRTALTYFSKASLLIAKCSRKWRELEKIKRRVKAHSAKCLRPIFDTDWYDWYMKLVVTYQFARSEQEHRLLTYRRLTKKITQLGFFDLADKLTLQFQSSGLKYRC